MVERDVSGAEPDFVVGKWTNWQGNYWVYEIRTGIIYYSNSLADAKEWIKLCRDALKETE
ncbi:hypothetical protein X917_gp01 [Pseudomonas phage PPpW-4]|uniref:Uncharacterized protein n=1 Tax=Pseudomonas phage PPpW-4 TaxID=1279083 RepID=V5YTF9_9CAUD|nr:hypothetical protein X917_gp01 [Pseudomonas phage PPpW-4]BAO20667.1 hypothetical protein [Pseudomonas phage PPpW-4]